MMVIFRINQGRTLLASMFLASITGLYTGFHSFIEPWQCQKWSDDIVVHMPVVNTVSVRGLEVL